MLIDPALTGRARLAAAADQLILASAEMAQSGRPLMRRVVPETGFTVWDHYPADDAVDQKTRARWFYHAHPPDQRDQDEHGHFHLFFDRQIFGDLPPRSGPVTPDGSDAGVVHIAALSIDLSGLPTRLFTVNRWVTDEWLYGASALIERLPGFDLSGAADGDLLVNRWLTAAVATFAPEIAQILLERDDAMAEALPPFFEDRSAEILSSTEIDLQYCVTHTDR